MSELPAPGAEDCERLPEIVASLGFVVFGCSMLDGVVSCALVDKAR